MNDEINNFELIIQPKSKPKGKLRLFLGYAPGVGKTFSMLNEANRRLKRGQNIIIGYIEPHDRPETLEQIGQLPFVPYKQFIYNGKTFTEPDVEEIIKVHPEIVLIDELAHTNAPGSKNEKRYQDVLEIINAGINVHTTMNIQHFDSLNDVIEQVTGIVVNETIPDNIIDSVDEIINVDLTPDGLRNRLQRGQVYKKAVIDNALQNFFRKGNLIALRELALRKIADDVDDDLQSYMHSNNIKEHWNVNEKVLVAISANRYSKTLILRGIRMANRLKCPLLVVDVEIQSIFEPKRDFKQLTLMHKYRNLAQRLGAQTFTLKGKSVASELTKFAIEKKISKLIIGHSNQSTIRRIFRGNIVSKLLKTLKNIEIIIVPTAK